MQCVVLNCGHDSTQTSQEITYHGFPTEPSLRAAWLEALHLEGWEPDDHSMVCSNHFLKKDLLLTNSGLCVLRMGAVPAVEMWACRICLATECNLYPMMAYSILSDTYESLTGFSIVNEDNYPLHLCSECGCRLLDCARFRNTCLRTHLILQEIVKGHGCITLDTIKSVRENHRLLIESDSEYHPEENAELIENGNTNKSPESNTCVSECFVDDDVKADNSSQVIGNPEDTNVDVSCISTSPEKSEVNGVGVESNAKDQNLRDAEDASNVDDNYAIDSIRTENGDGIYHGADGDLNHCDVRDRRGSLGEGNSSDDDITLAEANKKEKCKLSPSRLQMAKVSKHAAQRKRVVEDEIVNRKSSPGTDAQTTKSELQSVRVIDKSTPGTYSCNMCSFVSFKKNILKRHFKVHSVDKPYSCDVCKKSFDRKDAITKHMAKHSGKISYSCSFCSRTFDQKSKLTLHVSTHSSEKPYTCDVCRKNFSSKSNIAKHLKMHSRKKRYSCHACNKTFTRRNRLQMHLETHSTERPYPCDICNKAFKRKDQLTNHLTIHAGEKLFSCHVCKKSFFYQSALREHLRIHSGEKPYSCNVCNKAFAALSALRGHSRTHSGEKPFSCNVCKKLFTQRSNLKTHMRIHSGVKPYSCKVCDKSFNQKANLTTHQRLHTGDKPHTCRTCNKTFNQKHHLEKHMAKHASLRAK